MDQNEQRLHALEQLQQADEPLVAYDMGVLAAIRRSNPMLVARVDGVLRIEAAALRKRAARKKKPVPARRRPSVFDAAADHTDRLLP